MATEKVKKPDEIYKYHHLYSKVSFFLTDSIKCLTSLGIAVSVSYSRMIHLKNWTFSEPPVQKQPIEEMVEEKEARDNYPIGRLRGGGRGGTGCNQSDPL